MTNVNSSAVRHALNQTTAAREAIGYFIQRILQQFNNVNHSWNDQQSRRLYAIVLDSVTSLRTSYGELRSLEESSRKHLTQSRSMSKSDVLHEQRQQRA